MDSRREIDLDRYHPKIEDGIYAVTNFTPNHTYVEPITGEVVDLKVRSEKKQLLMGIGLQWSRVTRI